MIVATAMAWSCAAYAGDVLSIPSLARAGSDASGLGPGLYGRFAFMPPGSAATGADRPATALRLAVGAERSTELGSTRQVLNQDRAVMSQLEFSVSGGAFGSYDDFYTSAVIAALPGLDSALDCSGANGAAGCAEPIAPGPRVDGTLVAVSDTIPAPEPNALALYASAVVSLWLLRRSAERAHAAGGTA